VKYIALVLLAACNQVYSLGETTIDPDALPRDTDGDGFADGRDNCVDVPNDQADEDRDTVGDACDNCPIVPNADQEDTDDDRVGDRCDPHPADTKDCLVLFDSFNNRDRFAANWIESGAGSVDAQDGTVVMASSSRFSITPRTDDGQPLLGEYDVQATARGTITNGAFYIASVVNNAQNGYWCGTTVKEAIAVPNNPILSVRRLLSSDPLGDSIYLRQEIDNAKHEPTQDCLVEYGIVLGTVPGLHSSVVSGGPGVIVESDQVRVESFVAYQYIDATATCPSPIRR
jgi:hypothetical protein